MNRTHRTGRVCCVCCALVGSWLGQAAFAQTYKLIDLGPCEAQDINDSGQVIGSELAPSGMHRAFLWQAGVKTELGYLVADPNETRFSYAQAINDNGQVVGVADTDGDGPLHAFLWQAGVMADLGGLCGTTSFAYDINNAGQVIGRCGADFGPQQAFLWQDGVATDLGGLPGYTESWPTAINNAGQVAGYSALPHQPARVFLWDDGVVMDLGAPNDVYSAPTAVAEGGIVIGFLLTSEEIAKSFLWVSGFFVDLSGELPTGAILEDMNETGMVVGNIDYWHDPFLVEPFLDSADGQAAVRGTDLQDVLTDLTYGWPVVPLQDLIDPNLDVELRTARAVNDSGRIVGRMLNHTTDKLHGYVLMPIDPNQQYALTLAVAADPPLQPLGYIQADPPGPEYAEGDEVELHAVAGIGSTFAHWEVHDVAHAGDANYAVISTDNPLTIVMDADREVTAVFECAFGGGLSLPLLGILLPISCLGLWRRLR